MNRHNYKTNINESLIKDLGPHKILISDKSLKGKIIYGGQIITKTTTIGDKINVKYR